MNLRRCDLCGEVRQAGASWFFVSEGKASPSEWREAEHWCPSCVKDIRELHPKA